MSLIIPPPVAVRIARILTPKTSIFLRMPARAPDTANAMVPMMSVMRMNSSVVSIKAIIYVFARNDSYVVLELNNL